MQHRVVVAMSGGVDSSVVAAILKEQGYDVIGVTMQLYDYNQVNSNKQKTCCATKDIFDASSVAEKLNIPHYVLNYETEFKEKVIDKFVNSYLDGYTPIPCVLCNQTVKFNDLYDFAKKLGAKFLATGHYVKKIINTQGLAELHKGNDTEKDQSYFLYATTQKQLEFCEFPLGEMTKQQTREFARKYDLSISQKPDSQDICFVPNGDYFSVIQKYATQKIIHGDIVDIVTNQKIGTHEGIAKYTIGQRKGLGISNSQPLFVIKLDKEKNIVYVGEMKFLYKIKFIIHSVNFLCNEDEIVNKKYTLDFKLRSIQKDSVCGIIDKLENSNDEYLVTLINPTRAITPGQAAVFYNNTKLLGGGIIKKILDT